MTRGSRPRRGGAVGILARRRRRQWLVLAGGLVLFNVAVWLVVGGWAAQSAALIVSVLAAPLLHTLLFRR